MKSISHPNEWYISVIRYFAKYKVRIVDTVKSRYASKNEFCRGENGLMKSIRQKLKLHVREVEGMI